ncbi:MAG: hypothetical protein ACI4KG_05570 [Oscillospiraceae bacterium]
MNDDLKSNNTLQNENPVELTELFIQRRKTVTLWDTLTVQAIICVIIALGFIAINIFNNEMAADIWDIYNNKLIDLENPIAAFNVFIDLFKSIPLNNV